MPAILPKARMFNRYAVVTAQDDAQPCLPWFHTMFFEGSFTMTQATNFFQAHAGLRDRLPPNLSGYCTGPVEILAVSVPPNDYLPNQARTIEAIRDIPTQGFLNPYDWTIAKFTVLSLCPQSPQRIYVARNQWWRDI